MAALIPAQDRADARPHRGRKTTLFRFDQPAFWFYTVIVVVTGWYAISRQNVFHHISPSGWVLSWALLIVYALPVFLAVYLLDLYEREPMSLVIASLVWGAVAATTLAGLADEGWGLVVARLGGPEFASRWTAALTAPWVEETLKVAGVVLICLIGPSRVDDMMDGFVFGAMCGLGFAVVEDVFYFIGVFGGTTSGVLEGFYVRVVSSGLYGHVMYTGLAGMGVAYFFSRRGDASLRRRVGVGVGLFAIAVVGHFLWNSPWLDLFPAELHGVGDWLLIPFAAAIKGLPLVAFVMVAVWLARRRERRWLQAALSSEVGLPGISATELGILVDPVARKRSVRHMRTRAGDRAARLLKRLQREQINLAMIRTRTVSDDDPDLVRQRKQCKSIRDALMAMPGAAPAGRSGGASPG